MWRACSVLVAVAFLARPALAAGEEAKPDPSQPQAAPASGEALTAEITKLVEQLDAERFSERQAASQRLAQIGQPAASALAEAAVGESLEVTIRSIDVLRGLLDSPDQATKDAAKAALETIAKSDREAAVNRAKEAIKAQEEKNRAAAIRGGIPGGAIQIFGGAIQMGARRVSVRNANGVRDIDVEENDRKIKIHDDPKQAIKVEVITKKDGKDVSQTYEAKNAEELKKKHPEGYKLYQQYAENQGGVGIFQIQIQANAAPGQPQPNVPALPQGADALAEHRVRILTITLQSLNRQLEAAGKVAELPKAPQEAKDALKKQMAEVKQRLAEMESRLDEKPQPAAKPQ